MEKCIKVPLAMIEQMSALRLPVKLDIQLRSLMARDQDCRLKSPERDQLEALLELNETISVLRSRATQLLAKPRRSLQEKELLKGVNPALCGPDILLGRQGIELERGTELPPERPR
jgi:hypothetical protein